MHRCLELAKLGMSDVAPNPMVGCVIVHDGVVIGEGYHMQYGEAHAEVNAIQSVVDKSLLASSTLYVNLEPCAHFGKTPPCADLIVEYQIPKVVIGSVDTFSKVSGKGIERLKAKGFEVITGVLEHECRELNKRFFTFHEKKRPYIILKWAESEDGFIAPKNQEEPFWMTSKESKKIVHQWRAEEMGILIGTTTAVKDNPALTVREVKGRNPVRFVLDSKVRLEGDLKVFDKQAPTYVFTQNKRAENHLAVDFTQLAESVVASLYSKHIQSIIIEGGAQTLNTFIEANLWDEARIFIAPLQLGTGVKGPSLEKNGRKECVSVDQLITVVR